MRYSFVIESLEALIQEGILSIHHSVLVVAGAQAEKVLFEELGFRSVTISNLDDRMQNDGFRPFVWSRQDAQNLMFEDGSFDFAFVSDGLHHCSSPHTALLEMYRVARIGIIVVESRDSLLMKVANRLGLTPSYELEAVVGNGFVSSGVDNTQIPNYIYRWTEREFEKTIQSYDPTGKHTFQFYYGLNLPYSQAEMKKSSLKSHIVRLADPVLSVLTRLFRRQCNTFCMVALRPDPVQGLWPWLERKDGDLRFNRAYAQGKFKIDT